MPGIFVSYRRDDSQGFAGRLADDLGALFGPDQVFSDVEIPVGSDFSSVLHRAIADCDALLVVIGRHWVGRSEPGHRSRLFEPDDWVRTEIEAALAHRTWIVPVLVGGASMPAPESLPESLQPLTRIQAAALSDRRWDDDLAQIADLLHSRLGTLPPAAAPSQAPAPTVPVAIGGGIRLARRIGLAFGRLLRRVLTLVAVAAVFYAGLRLFGDASTLRLLDTLDARLLTGWERLLAYARRW